MKLTPVQILDRWLFALRSGGFIQTYGRLKAYKNGQPTHCCFGVLCEIMEVPVSISGQKISFDGHYGYPPTAITKTIKMTQREMTSIAKANDQGIAFNAIADRIEKLLRPRLEQTS